MAGESDVNGRMVSMAGWSEMTNNGVNKTIQKYSL